MTGVPVHFCVWKEEEFDDIRAFCEEKVWDYKDYRLYLYYVNHNLNEISFQTSVRMEFSQVSNKESVENRSKACAKPKVLNFIFNNSNIFAFQIFDLNRIIYNCNGYSFHKEASAKMLTNDGENLIVQVTSISYFDNLLFKT